MLRRGIPDSLSKQRESERGNRKVPGDACIAGTSATLAPRSCMTCGQAEAIPQTLLPSSTLVYMNIPKASRVLPRSSGRAALDETYNRTKPADPHMRGKGLFPALRK